MKDQMNNTMGTQNQNMMDQKPMQMQKMMKQMNKTGMMTGPTDK
jgi:hypothetical protein